jgi:hypothetical protein
VRLRSRVWIAFLPPVDIARRRSIEACRATDAVLPGCAEREPATGAAADPVLAAGCAAPAGRPALPALDIALRRAITSSRVLLYAIVNPVA